MCTGMEIGMMALSGAGQFLNMRMQQQQAAMAARIARQKAAAEAEAARQRAEAEYAEANRQIAEAQDKELEDKSDIIREANEQLGTLRAGETALTEGSLGNVFFEQGYAHSADLVRITEQTDKLVAAGRSQKAASSQGFTNAVTIAQNNMRNDIMRANAASTAAVMGFVSSGLQIGAGALKHHQTIEAIKGT